MVTSRTGTASHKRFRRDVLNAGRRAGIIHCPMCGVELDYSRGLQPNSAEPDHVIPVTHGGADSIENSQVLCRMCNIRKGNRLQRQPLVRTVTNLVNW